MALNLTKQDSVLKAIEEFEIHGRDAFLSKYGYGKAREYFLFHEGKRYDSKAIAGVAQGYETKDDGGPLSSEDFSGGEATVQRALENLGFTVFRIRNGTQAEEIPLVLTQNEVTVDSEYDFWRDDTGVLYQYPNIYRNRVRTGRPFIYYRGVRRLGGRRGEAEYFGRGIIGDIWRDPAIPESSPKSQWRWYCSIEDYSQFTEAVPATKGDQRYEDISSPLGWRTAVRVLSWGSYQEILRNGGLPVEVQFTDAPPIDEVDVEEVRDLGELLIDRSGGGGTGSGNEGMRLGAQSKQIGDRGEEIVYRWLRSNLPDTIRESVEWIAQTGRTPGWDIQYFSQDEELIAIEVKATTLTRFASIELTANEWDAAEELGARYSVALVSQVMSQKPRLGWAKNPYNEVEYGRMAVYPTGWRLTRTDG